MNTNTDVKPFYSECENSPMGNEKTKVAEIHPTVLRLEPELRATLVKLAERNGRSLSKEIAVRLQGSLFTPADLVLREPDGRRTYVEVKTGSGKTGAGLPPMAAAMAELAGSGGIEEELVRLVEHLTIEKKLALLALLK